MAVGFGRTGTMFACQQEDVAPDLMCVAKGITGGYLPLAATLTTEEIYESFLGEHAELRTFFHGHTYTGNPLACAAALATLDVFEEERTLERLAPKIVLLGELLDELVAPLPTVAEIRRRGFMTGIELIAFPLDARMGHRVTLAARRRGAIVRPLGDTIVLMPPLSITEDELISLVGITAGAIEEATGAGSGSPRDRRRRPLEDDEDTGPIRLWPALVALGVAAVLAVVVVAVVASRRQRRRQPGGGRGADDADRAGRARATRAPSAWSRSTSGCLLPTRATADLRADAVAFTVYGQDPGGGCTADIASSRCNEVVLPQAVGPRRVSCPSRSPSTANSAEALAAAGPCPPMSVEASPSPRTARSRPCGRRRRGSTSRTGCR